MQAMEKLNIYVPTSTAEALDRDARQFGILKRSGNSINRNRLLNLVLLGYCDSFAQERSLLAEKVSQELSGVIDDKGTLSSVSHDIARAITSPISLDRRGKGYVRLPLKPTKETEGLVRDIVNDLGNDTVSRYFNSLFASYCSKASWERERILCKKAFDLLEEACASKRIISFNTRRNTKAIQRVVPYKVAIGSDELHNYLLCFEEDNQKRGACTYRLDTIVSPRVLDRTGTIPEEVERHLKLMAQQGPQFVINSDEKARVRLTEAGVRAYQSIYLGRPVYDHIEEQGNDQIYHFRCSEDQLFMYFRRFGPQEAEVIAPASLRRRIIQFHKGALEMYE